MRHDIKLVFTTSPASSSPSAKTHTHTYTHTPDRQSAFLSIYKALSCLPALARTIPSALNMFPSSPPKGWLTNLPRPKPHAAFSFWVPSLSFPLFL